MKVGVPREVKNHEYRVALTPVGAHELTSTGTRSSSRRTPGSARRSATPTSSPPGARIIDSADDVWGESDMVLKVKEPVAEEYHRMREGLTLFTYLHLAADKPLTEELAARKVTGIAYETVQLTSGALPLLYPMSRGRRAASRHRSAPTRSCAPRAAAACSWAASAASQNAKVVILGAGVSGQNAANIALGMGADVTLLDTDLDKLRMSFWRYDNQVHGLASSKLTVQQQVLEADMVIGAVLIPGAAAPKLVTNDLVAQMKPGSVLVDIAIDQGGCFEDSRPTTHADPTFPVHNSVFYCVANMPGAVPNTSTYALTNSTLPYAVKLANQGWRDALRGDRALGPRPQHPWRARHLRPRRRGPRDELDLAGGGALLTPGRHHRATRGTAVAPRARRARVARPRAGRARRLRQHPRVLRPRPAGLRRLPRATGASTTAARVPEADVTDFLASLIERGLAPSSAAAPSSPCAASTGSSPSRARSPPTRPRG